MQIDAVTESTLIKLRQMSDEVAAVALGQRLRALESLWKRSFYERGIILHEVKQRLLWKHLNDDATGEPYTSFDRWVLDSAPHSRSDAYAALKVVEDLRDIPRHELEQVPRCNLHILQALSSNIRQSPEVLQWATFTSQKDFVARLEHFYPEQAIESRCLIHLNPTKSASVIISRAVNLAKRLEGLTTREDVLEFWAADYLSEHPEEETA